MRNLWIILTLCLTAVLSGGRIAEAAKTPSQADDLYLDDTGSGGYYPEDDDDFNSGSGSGGGEDTVEEPVTVSMVYIQPNAAQPTPDSTRDFTPRVDTATVREKARESTPKKPIRTEQVPVPVTEDMQRNQVTSTTSSPGSPQEPVEVRTENLFQRTEVLAGM
ncbi:syndecan-2 isoform X1 [Cynoglossus semilaevis]|uniref:syndecan-2 isoform X1 n=1 Tax=Cynoglossus semilaevis TaxID=244447 RepID=UPI000D62448E|nr:syndecan-2-A-like isoform X1 [Cynoglossus semilaevis]